MSNPRVFSEKEAAEILQRAARLQESAGNGGYTAGVTFEELRKIAAETGIDESSLQKALEAPAQTTNSIFNLVEETERVIDGEMTDDGMDAFAEVMSKYGRLQQTTQIGRSFSGYINGGTIYAKVELHSRNGRTRLKVKSLPVMAYLMGLHAPLIFSIVAGAAIMGNGAVALGLAIMGALLMVGFLLFSYLAKTNITRSRQLADEVESVLRESNKKALAKATSAQSGANELQQRLNQS